MHSIRRRLVVFIVLIAVLVPGAAGIYSYWRIRTDLLQDLQKTGAALAIRLQASLPPLLGAGNLSGLEQVLEAELHSGRISHILIERDGTALLGLASTAGGKSRRIDRLPVPQHDDIQFTLASSGSGHPPGKVFVRLAQEPIETQLRKIMLEKVVEVGLLVAILILALVRSLELLFGRPLQHLQNRLQHTARHDDSPPPVEAAHSCDRYVEFAGVADACSRVADRVQQDHGRRLEAEQGMRQAHEETESANRQLSETQSSLVQSEKMASLGRLVAGIAHEINTPVGVIVTSASVLRDDAQAFKASIEAGTVKKSDVIRYSETAVQSATLIQSNAERAASLIQGFKQVAVDQTSEARRVFDLRHYLEEVILSLRPAWKHSALTMQIDCPEKIEVDGYPGALSQILTNLVTNSLNHAFEPGQSGEMHLEACCQNGQVRIVFSDNGRGIPPENLGRIFDPFFTTRRGKGGSGLGLSITYNLVTETLGGTITVCSAPGEGATFTISFPRIAPVRPSAQ